MSYYNNRRRKSKPNPTTQLKKLRKENPDIQPVIVGKKLAESWWAQAWNANLESYADYSNRIGRGRTYVRNGSVLDLSVKPGEVSSLVQGTSANPYEITIEIEPLSKDRWNAIIDKCSRSVANLEDLVSGKFPQELMELFTNKDEGLFPSPEEIKFHCSCPDWASMCKHIAATLYGIGARFDSDPTLFFHLRDIDFADLLKKSVEEKMENMLKNAGKVTSRVITDTDTFELFGV